MRHVLRHAWIAVALLWFHGNALATFGVELRPDPNPPSEGENRIGLTLKDQEGKPVIGAKIAIEASMPAMGAMPRMAAKARITDAGGGRYDAVYELSMGGTWEIEIGVEKDGKQQTFNYSLTTGIPNLSDRNVTMPEQMAGDASGTGGGKVLKVGPSRLQKIGVRFADASVRSLEREIRAVGVIESDRTERAEVTLRFGAFVERQFEGRIGETVARGAPLFAVYSPELVSAQSEFLLGLHATTEGVPARSASAARERLRNLGISDADIRDLERTKQPKRLVTIAAPVSGTLLEVNVRQGSAVEAGQVAYVIGDLSKTYVVAKIFQRDLAHIRSGARVEIHGAGVGSSQASGKVDLIYPGSGESTGSGNVRVRSLDQGASLRPGLFVDLRFPVTLGQKLSIPAEAVNFSGKHAYVFLDRGGGALEPVEVTVGVSAGEFVEILSGLKAGDRVVASGNFLISSEAQLRNALPKWKSDPSSNVDGAQRDVRKDEPQRAVK